MKSKYVFLLICLLTIAPLVADEIGKKPLKATAQFVYQRTNQGIESYESAVRAAVTLKNSQARSIKNVEITGRFLNPDGEELHQDKVTLAVGSRGEEAGYLYYSNPSNLYVTKILIGISYQFNGEVQEETLILEKTDVEPVQYNK